MRHSGANSKPLFFGCESYGVFSKRHQAHTVVISTINGVVNAILKELQ